VFHPIARIDENADDGPHPEANPRECGEKGHQSEASRHAEEGHQGHEWKPERAWLIWSGVPKNHHAETDEDEGEQCPNVGHVSRIADRDEGG
jgi:hypothetical protein